MSFQIWSENFWFSPVKQQPPPYSALIPLLQGISQSIATKLNEELKSRANILKEEAQSDFKEETDQLSIEINCNTPNRDVKQLSLGVAAVLGTVALAAGGFFFPLALTSSYLVSTLAWTYSGVAEDTLEQVLREIKEKVSEWTGHIEKLLVHLADKVLHELEAKYAANEGTQMEAAARVLSLRLSVQNL
eukprot:TRINITY_DN5641_c0_g1_i1.p1 TRINITY_DN5641_c0_g1~~TRINITY_DN5641_c0_g1_i1.p1  ORF type:complete len:189 (+),score=39.75 TRINITY_DN5641_c0_g1_i1:644-1210(+)